MSKFIGIKNNKIQIVSDKEFVNSDLQILKLPNHLSNTTPNELISNYIVKNDEIFHKTDKRNIKKLKVAIITNWKMRCGISTYAEYLLKKMLPQLGDFKIFAEYNEFPTGKYHQIDDFVFDKNRVEFCWKRGDNLSELIQAIKKYDPDIVWCNHEWGLFPVARHFLAMLTQLSQYRFITTMHSTFYHRDKTICEAACPELIVHLEGSKNILKNEKQIPGKVFVVPHGCAPCSNKERLWNFYKSDITIVMSGFGFKYKRWEAALEAVAIIKQKYTDVFFTGLFSESPYATLEHQKYYEYLLELISKLKIEDNVALIRGYQSDQSLDSFLRTNKVALFPYVSTPGHEVYGASGAARLAMSKGIPVISSSIPHFQDLPTIKADSPEDMANEIMLICKDNSRAINQVNIQNQFLEENSWKKVSDRYIEIFELGNV